MKRAEDIVKNAMLDSGAEFENDTDRIKEDCGLDSLSLVAVIVQLEEAMGKEFDDSDLEPAELITVGDLIALTEKHL